MDTIVVVDDDEIFRDLLKTVLNLEGYQTAVVTTVDEVMPTVRRTDPALVLMDVHIRRDDTLGLLRELEHNDTLGCIPVIMTSGMDRSFECLEAGADAFVLKPFRPDEILSKIKDLI